MRKLIVALLILAGVVSAGWAVFLFFRAAAGWDVDPDPGLDAVGVDQATVVADLLASTGPAAIVSSPLRRCRETARFLADSLAAEVVIADEVAEIPSPDGYAMEERVGWLREAMTVAAFLGDVCALEETEDGTRVSVTGAEERA